MPDLEPIPETEIAPRIARHLETGERVLWQGAPRRGTFVHLRVVIGIGFAVAFGILMPLGALDGYVVMPGEPLSATRFLPADIALVIGLALAAATWRTRDGLWAYAITDRRLLSVVSDWLHRAVGPEDIRGFGTWRDAAYWKHVTMERRTRTGPRRDRRFPGFHGLADSKDMLRTLQDWREGFSRRANAGARDFVYASRTGGQDDPQEAVPDGMRRIRHHGTGLVVDVPETWEATVSRDRDGPVQLFGVTLLRRFIREGEKEPYREGADWTSLVVRGAPECGLDLRIVPGPLTLSLDDVLNDPWTKAAGLEVLKTTPDLETGGLRGFSVVRKGSEGAQVSGFGEARGPVAMRQAWLGLDDAYLEIRGLARLDQPDVQRAVDSMIESIRIG